MFSFGDIVLPFVGILAVGMLIFAAKLFFFDSLPASSGISASVSSVPSVPRIKSKAEDNNPLFPAAGEASAEEVSENSAVSDDNHDNNNQESKKDDNKDAENLKNLENLENLKKLGNSGNNKNSAVKIQAKNPVKVTTANVNNKPQSQQKPEVKKQAQWRVQVGAYGSKKAAEEIIAKLAKSGYTATHFAVSRHHKVWVQAGSTKEAAEETAKKLQKIGYKGSYVIAPPPRN